MQPSIVLQLKRVPIFAGLDSSALQALAECCRHRKFRAGQTLFHTGDAGVTLYLIVSGRVNIQTELSSGKPLHLAQRGPGDHFGEMALIDGKPRMADAVAAEDCELLTLGRDALMHCIQISPHTALAIMASLAERLREAAELLADKQELDVLGRTCEALLDLAEAYGHESPTGGTRIGIKLSQQDLADRIGATRESVNRALAGLKRVAAIRSEGRDWILLKPEKLRQRCTREG